MSNAKYITCTDTAKLLREALKKAFPGQVFSVKSKTYSGGASITVRWLDGLTESQVEQITGQFSGATFDGMQDLKEYHTSINEAGESVRYGADFVFTDRDYSPELTRKLAADVATFYRLPEVPVMNAWNWYDDGIRLNENTGVGRDTFTDRLREARRYYDAIAGQYVPRNEYLPSWLQLMAEMQTPPVDSAPHVEPDGTCPYMIENQRGIAPGGEWLQPTPPLKYESELAKEYPNQWHIWHTAHHLPGSFVEYLINYCNAAISENDDSDLESQFPNEWAKWVKITDLNEYHEYDDFADYLIEANHVDSSDLAPFVLKVNKYKTTTRYFDPESASLIISDERKTPTVIRVGDFLECTELMPDDNTWLDYVWKVESWGIRILRTYGGHRCRKNELWVDRVGTWYEGGYAYRVVGHIDPEEFRSKRQSLQAVFARGFNDPLPAAEQSDAQDTFSPCPICQGDTVAPTVERGVCDACHAKIVAYSERLESRLERLRSYADKVQREGQADYNRAHTMADGIPFGQPILVGHHSEGRDRNYRERIHNTFGRAFAKLNRAAELERRADRAEKNRAISSDNPAAVLLLQDKLAKLEANQAAYKNVNAAIRKLTKANPLPKRELIKGDYAEYQAACKAVTDTYPALAPELARMTGLSEKTALECLTPDYAGRIGLPSYVLSNNNAEIRRVKQRIADLQQKAALVDSPELVKSETFGDIELVRDPEENRLRLHFPGKPAPAIITELKARGFHWSGYNKAWQRQLNNAAEYAAKCVIELARKQ